MKQKVEISPFKDCKLQLTGEFSPKEEDCGYQGEFQIEKIEYISGDVLELLERSRDNFKFIDYLEELAIQECEQFEPDYEKD